MHHPTSSPDGEGLKENLKDNENIFDNKDIL